MLLASYSFIKQKKAESIDSAFLFAQRSWQTRQVERSLSHPD
jgi:hypothetical protein